MFKKLKDVFFACIRKELNRKEENIICAIVLACQAVFFGAYIPLNIISANPIDFIINDHSPLLVLPFCILVYFVVAVVAFLIYFFTPKTVRKILIVVYTVITIFAIINFMIHGNEFDIMTQLLTTDGTTSFKYEVGECVKNFALLALVIICSFFITKISIVHKNVFVILFISLIAYSAFSIITIQNKISPTLKIAHQNIVEQKGVTIDEIKPIYNLSKNHENVIVFMLDRFTGKYFAKVLEMFPEYKEKFDGFTFYPNTLSFGYQTTSGSPGLFGGYDYIPVESDKREGNIVDKHNEAITMMPKIFSENGYNVVYSNLPDVNYGIASKPNPFGGLKNTRHLSYAGHIKDPIIDENQVQFIIVQTQHFMQYPICVTAPIAFKDMLYNNGSYFMGDSGTHAYTSFFIRHYLTLISMRKQTSAVETTMPQAIIINNALAHERAYLSYPEFEVTHDTKKLADETKFDLNVGEEVADKITRGEGITGDTRLANYQFFDTCVFITKQLASWIDYLKEQGVYDNTRIIFVADHGLGDDTVQLSFPSYEVFEAKFHMGFKNLGFSPLYYNPVLIVKDFNERGSIKISDEFMTNADTPTIALKDLIENPINPYTGNKISSEYKKNNNKFYIAGAIAPWEPFYHIDDTRHEPVNRTFLSLKGKDIFDLSKWNAIINFKGPVCDEHIYVKQYKPEVEVCGTNNTCDYYKCSACGQIFMNEGDTIAIRPSDVTKEVPCVYTNYVSDHNATKENHGTMTARCDRCGLTTDTKYDPDSDSDHYAETAEAYIPATIDHDGFKGLACKLCGKELETDAKYRQIGEIKMEYETTIHDGEHKKPEVVVYDVDGKVISNDSYTVRYNKNIFPGFAKATVHFSNGYEGSVEKSFIIYPDTPIYDTSSVKKRSVTIKFKKYETKVNGIEVDYSYDPAMPAFAINSFDERINSDSEVKINGVYDEEKENYIRYRTYRNDRDPEADEVVKLYSEWSDIISIGGNK